MEIKAAEWNLVFYILEFFSCDVLIEDLFKMRKVTADCFEVWEFLANFKGHVSTATTNISQCFDVFEGTLKLYRQELSRKAGVVLHHTGKHFISAWSGIVDFSKIFKKGLLFLTLEISGEIFPWIDIGHIVEPDKFSQT